MKIDMKIESVETFQVQLPARRPHTWSGSVIGIGGFVIIKLQTDEGLVGLGEAPISTDWEATSDATVGSPLAPSYT